MYVFTDSTLRHLLKKIKSKIALKSELDNKLDKVDEIELFSFEPEGIKETIESITKKIDHIEDLKIFYSPLNTSYTFEDLYYIEGGEDYLPSYNLTFETYYGGVYLYIDILGDNYYRFTIDYHEYLRENTVINFTLEKEKGLSDNDFTDSAKSLLETKFTSVEASYSTGMTHIKFSNESNTKTIDLKTGCDMFFYPTIDTELLADLNGNVTIPYAFISKSGSDIGKVTVNIENLTNNTNSENIFNVTDNGSELILEGASSGNANVSFTIEGSTEELKANVLGEYSTVIMLPLTVYRSTDSSLVPSNVSNTKTVVSDFGNGEYEIMLYTATSTNYFNFSNIQTLTNVSYISNSITNMDYTYNNCQKLTGSPICGDNVTTMYYTYQGCRNLTGSPVCGPNVTNMSYAYYYCNKLTGTPVCGPNVEDMSQTYSYCYKLTGSPICGPNVTNMYYTYSNCTELTGNPVCEPNITNMSGTYYNCSKLTGSPVCGDKATSMSSAYYNCCNLTGNPVCGSNIIYMYQTYYNCQNLTGSPVCGNNVTTMADAYYNCYSLTGNPVCGPNVTIMSSTYYNCSNLTGTPVCGPNVTIMSSTYYNCSNLTGNPVCGPNVIIMSSTYYNCSNLTGTPVCGPNVTNMSYTYDNCTNLTGSPVCGNNVTNMYNAYRNCSKLTGNPVCGDKVKDMFMAYTACKNLTGSPVCGSNVTNMYLTYSSCYNLTGAPVCGPNVTTMHRTYFNCQNLHGDFYVLSDNVSDTTNCFYGRNVSNQLNIIVNFGTNSYNSFRTNSIIGSSLSWTNDMATNGCYYNTVANIYIYPVENVSQVYKENELLVARYTMSSGANVIPEVDSATMTTTEDVTNDNGTITRSVYLDESQAGELPSSISFNGETDLLTVEKLKIDNITDTSYMFNGCSNLTSVCASDWDTSKIIKADYMFAGCSKLTKESFNKDVIYNIPMHVTNEDDLDTLPLNSIDDFVKIENVVGIPYTLEDFQKYEDYYELKLETSGILRIDSTGHIKLEATDEPGVDVTVTVYYKNGDKISFELPNVESASHIFDGCTNLL